MSLLLRQAKCSQGSAPRLFGSAFTPYGRSAAYRRMHTSFHDLDAYFVKSRNLLPIRVSLIHDYTLLATPLPSYRMPSSRRYFSFSPSRYTKQAQREEVKDPPRTEKSSEKNKDSGSANGSGESQQSGSSRREGPGSGKGKEKEGTSNEPPPPPPPHGDKTPWQVFTETLRSEFKASKEWNESTKALASSAHQFTENESIKRAKAAYTAASGAATSTTSSALKSTGKVLGQGAAWTWDTPVVKGVRAGVSATGKGLDKVTKPVRETAAFKSVKEVIDDGSSSRYGGWVEKEERRKKRELRELNEARAAGFMGKHVEKIEEDPK